MKRFLLTMSLLAGWLAWGGNLVPDASFESPVPYTFDRNGGRGNLYFVDKVYSESAAEGRHVLLLACWAPRADVKPVLSPPFRLTDAGPYAFSAQVRSRGQGGSLRVALADAAGKPLLDLAEYRVDGANAWTPLAARAIARPDLPSGDRFRLAFLLEGDGIEAEVEVDQLALTAGAEPPDEVADNAQYHRVEAETLAAGEAWKPAAHARSYTNGPPPSGERESAVLTGSGTVAPEANEPAVWRVAVSRAGDFRLWLRFHHSAHGGGFTVTVAQAGQTLCSQAVDETSPSHGTIWSYAWASFDLELAPGPLTVSLERPAAGCSWTGRRLDLLLLTDELDYRPDVQDFIPPVWMQWENTAAAGEPYVLWGWIRRRAEPWWGVPGILSRAGNNAGYYPPRDRRQWVGPGQATPWVRLNPYVMDRGHNNLLLVATRVNHSDGYVTGEHLSGVLRFALGDPPRLLREIPIDQDGPRLRLTLPGNLAAEPGGLKTGWDWYREARAALDAAIASQGPLPAPARLNAMATFSLDAELDDPALVAAEIALLKDMGFNNLYHVGPNLDRAAFGLRPDIATGGSLHYQRLNHCYNQPDEPKIRQQLEKLTAQWDDRRERVVLWKDADERALDRLEHTVECPVCDRLFRAWLPELGLTLDSLSAGSEPLADWSQVKPAGVDGRARQPALYYWTQMFRIESYRRFARDCQERVQARFPNARSYNNISPPVTYSSWMGAGPGNELFQLIRDGQGMAWSEDWTGFGVGPMHIEYLLSMMRVACRPEGKPIGMYIVAGDGPVAELRTKIVQAVAGGASHGVFYSYGPTYAGLDDWSARHDRYPVIREALADIARVEAPMAGLRRRPATVAVLYNRTAGIWEVPASDNSAEMDAQFVYWALRHAGAGVDVIPEEDVEAGLLDGYRTVFVGGHWLRRATADRLAAWVRAAPQRTLVGLAAAGQRDEYDRPLATLDELFGVASSTLERHGIPTRPKYELPGLKPLGTVTAGAVTFPELAWRERVIATAGTDLLATAADGAPAILRRPAGQGTAIRFACLPGLAYLHRALHRMEEGQAGWGAAFDTGLRDLIAHPVAPADRLIASPRPLLVPTRFDGEGRALLFLVDYSYEAPGEVTVTLPAEPAFTRATAGRGQPVTASRTPAGLALTFAMDRNTETLLLE